MSTANTSTDSRSNMSLWILIASFAIPIALAFFYYFLGDRPAVKSNGELVIPVVDVRTLELKNNAGDRIDELKMSQHWRMVYFAPAHCDKVCSDNLFKMRQTQIGMGKFQDRVKYAIVHLETPDATFQAFIAKEHPDAVIFHSQSENLSALLKSDTRTADPQAIYLIDPIGNIMMEFSKTLDPKLMRKDLKKLLKISRIG